jgi:hypothetical protein
MTLEQLMLLAMQLRQAQTHTPALCTHPAALEQVAACERLGLAAQRNGHSLLALKHGHLDDLRIAAHLLTDQACHELRAVHMQQP